MNKPISILIQELTQNLTKTVNESGLSPVIAEPYVRDFYNMVKDAAINQMQQEAKQYKEVLGAEDKDEGSNPTKE